MLIKVTTKIFPSEKFIGFSQVISVSLYVNGARQPSAFVTVLCLNVPKFMISLGLEGKVFMCKMGNIFFLPLIQPTAIC